MKIPFAVGTRRAALAAGVFALASVSSFSSSSSATSIIRDASPPQYHVEIEPHLNIQWFGFDYASDGLGPGIRFGIPIMSPGFIKKINDSVAINFGADFLYYHPIHNWCDRNGCYSGDSFWVLYSPVTLQWNFWLTEKWSVFGEPGLTFRVPFSDYCDGRWCDKGSLVWFAFYAGARWHFGERTALTMRLGYPNGISVGVSFF